MARMKSRFWYTASRGAAIPAFVRGLLLRGPDLDEFLQFGLEEAPAALHVLDQLVRAVLGGHRDLADAGMDAVGQRKIDDPELPGEGDGGLGQAVGEVHQAAAASTRQDQGEGIFQGGVEIVWARIHRQFLPLWFTLRLCQRGCGAKVKPRGRTPGHRIFKKAWTMSSGAVCTTARHLPVP